MIDKDTLLGARLAERDVDIPGLGTVRVRPLSRLAALRVQQAGAEDAEVTALAEGLVLPAITVDEARHILDNISGPDLQPVIDAILGASAMFEGAQKSNGTRPDVR